jgi:hypothetical protein
VARNLQRRYDARAIRILPVPMRVDLAEKAKADAGRSEARRRFPGLPSGMTAEQRDAYWAAVQIPYQAYYAYEETLAVFGDLPGSSQTLLSAYEALTRYITEGAVATMPMIDAGTRARIIARFTRQPVAVEEEVTLQYAPEDQLWAEWIQHVLVAAGVRVNDPWVAGASTEEPSASGGRILTIVSRANADAESAVVPSDPHGGREPLAIYVADLAPLPHLPIANTASIVDLSADAAADRLLRLVGRDRASPAPTCSAAPGSPATARWCSARPLATRASPAERTTYGSCGRNCAPAGRPSSSRGRCRWRCTAWAGSARPRSRWSTPTGSGPPTTSCGGSARTR